MTAYIKLRLTFRQETGVTRPRVSSVNGLRALATSVWSWDPSCIRRVTYTQGCKDCNIGADNIQSTARFEWPSSPFTSLNAHMWRGYVFSIWPWILPHSEEPKVWIMWIIQGFHRSTRPIPRCSKGATYPSQEVAALWESLPRALLAQPRTFLGVYNLASSATKTKDSMPPKSKLSFSTVQTAHKYIYWRALQALHTWHGERR